VKNRVLPTQKVTDAVARLEALSGEIVKATEEQVRALKELGNSNRLCIIGGAGTGKTLIGIAAARHAANSGKRVLFLSGGGLLHQRILDTLSGSEVTVITMSEFVENLANALEDVPPTPPTEPSVSKWFAFSREQEVVLEKFEEVLPGSGLYCLNYDYFIVDEAQMLINSFIDRFTNLASLGEDQAILLLADPSQRLEVGSWTPPLEYRLMVLTQNCRNADKVSFLLQLITGSTVVRSAVEGIDVRLLVVPGRGTKLTHRLIASTIDEVKYLSSGGIKEIVVLTHGWERDELRDGLVNALPSVQVESILDFRGSEADCIVAVLPRATRFPFYVSASRARVALSIIAHEDAFTEVASVHLKEAAAYASGQQNVSEEAIGLAMTYFVID
jgi:hypothetical protein